MSRQQYDDQLQSQRAHQENIHTADMNKYRYDMEQKQREALDDQKQRYEQQMTALKHQHEQEYMATMDR